MAAEKQYQNAPQSFTFGGRRLSGFLEYFSGSSERRSVDHEYLKRHGGKVEDFGRKQRRLEVKLQFIGSTCGKDFTAFEKFVHDQPTRKLTHPIAGNWIAFCEGPKHKVDFNESTNKIEVVVSWKESELDAALPVDTPDVATAAQAATAKQTAFQAAIATYMGQLAKTKGVLGQAQNQIDNALALVDTATAPVTLVRGAIAGAVGAGSAVVGSVNKIAVQTQLLATDMTNYAESAVDLFNGVDAAAGQATQNAANLQAVLDAGQALTDLLMSTALTPAGAGEAVGQVQEAVASCQVLADALAAASPPTVIYVVPRLTNLIALAQRLVKEYNLDRDALSYASSIMSLNRIPDPGKIPGGTRLTVPTR